MRRIDYINSITSNAARFVLEVEGFNATGQYHINIHAENFLIPVLNEVFSIKLENLNATQKKNFPAVDLADFGNRVAFQITATADLAKIKATVGKFFEHELEKHFDTLYVYILTHKKERYSQEKIDEIITSKDVQFSVQDHVIDKDDLLQKINSISATPALEHLAKLFNHEFSDVQIEARKKGFDNGFLRNIPEEIFPNLLPISFPDKLFIAELAIDKEEIIKDVNQYLVSIGKREIKSMKPAKLVSKALRKHGGRSRAWVLHEKHIYTFRDFHDANEPMSKIVDKGTIEAITAKEFYETNEDKLRVFKNLLRNTFTEFCISKGIEFYALSGVYRFANNKEVPNKKQIKWKGKNEATKTVIFEVNNKKEGHIICFRSLAFRASFENFGDSWFLGVTPTWSFTNPYGYKRSRFEPAYMSGIKRLENNGSIYNYFRFFGYHLTYTDLFTQEYSYFKVYKPFTLELIPSLDDKSWKPVKIPDSTTIAPEVSMEADIELSKTLFD